MAKLIKIEKEEILEKKLWKAADKLRKNMDAAEYKHVVLGLIFLKYISDAFEELYNKLKEGKGDYEGADPEDKNEYVAEKAKELATENKPEQISKILKILRPIINFIRNLIRMDSGVQLNDNHILWVLRDAKRMD